MSSFIPQYLLQNLKNSLVAKQTIDGGTLGRLVDSWVAFGDRATIFLQHCTALPRLDSGAPGRDEVTWGTSAIQYSQATVNNMLPLMTGSTAFLTRPPPSPKDCLQSLGKPPPDNRGLMSVAVSSNIQNAFNITP